MSALRSLLDGAWMVLRAPALLAGVALLTLMTALPFGLVLGSRLQTALAHQPPIWRDAGEIDPEWWREFRHHARGIEATFTPTVIGFAAPLDNLSALLDRTPRPWVMVAPAVLYGLVWVFLWGGVLERFARGRGLPPRAFWAAGRRHAPRIAVISLAAGAASLALFLTVHPVLFGPVYDALAAGASHERSAFLWRLALYCVFGGLLAAVSLVADYSRIGVVTGAGTAREAFGIGGRFTRRHAAPVALLYVLTGMLFVALLVLYGATEAWGGARVGGWRAVLIGQGFILGRLAIRLTGAAAEVRLYQRLNGTAPQASIAPG